MIEADCFPLRALDQGGVELARHTNQQSATRLSINNRSGRLRDWISGRAGGLDPRLNRVLCLSYCLRLSRAEGRAARQIGRRSDEALVFVAPKNIYGIPADVTHRGAHVPATLVILVFLDHRDQLPCLVRLDLSLTVLKVKADGFAGPLIGMMAAFPALRRKSEPFGRLARVPE